MFTGMPRRDLLLGAAGLGVGAAVARLPGAPATGPAHQDFVRGLHAALSPAQRAEVFLPWEHPSRQLVNTEAILKKPHVGTLLNGEQMPYVWGLWQTMLSAQGAARYREPLRAEGGGLDGCVLLVYGDPVSGPCQSVISGGHLQVRGGHIPNGGVGDAMSYGHQIGNGIPRIPGNVWAFQADAANALFALLTEEQRQQAVQAEPPYELTVQVQDERGTFTGVPGAAMDDAQHEQFSALLATILETYPQSQARAARADIEANGGLDALHVSYYTRHAYYADGVRAGAAARAGEVPYYQVWRIEGPGTVMHFKGDPHVHAYLHVTREPRRQHVGEALAETGVLLGERDLKSFIERTLQRFTAADFAVYPGAVPARFPPGPVSEGLVWSLDPYGNEVEVVTLRGEHMAEPLRRQLGVTEPGRSYRVASLDFYLDTFGAEIGVWQQRLRSGVLLRDALVSALREDARSLTG